MKFLLALEVWTVRWASRVAFVGLAGLLAMSLAILVDVTLRWLFGTPLHGLDDVNGILISIIVAAFFPVLLVERKNVTIDVLGKLLGPRSMEWLNAFGHLVTLLFISVVAWQVAEHAARVATQETLILRLPAAPGWWLTAALFALCVPMQLLVFAVQLGRAVTGQTAADRPASDFG